MTDKWCMEISERLTRVEVKLDTLLEAQREKSKRWCDAGVRTWLALITAGASIIIALVT